MIFGDFLEKPQRDTGRGKDPEAAEQAESGARSARDDGGGERPPGRQLRQQPVWRGGVIALVSEWP